MMEAAMKSQISRWGNSLAVRIPKAYADRLGFEEGASVFIYESDGKLVVEQPAETLDELLAAIKPDNLHGETEWGQSKGREEW
jgi:antitoxin MazE